MSPPPARPHPDFPILEDTGSRPLFASSQAVGPPQEVDRALLEPAPGLLSFGGFSFNPIPVLGHGPGEVGLGGAPGRRDHQLALGGDREADASAPGAETVFDFQVFQIKHFYDG